MGNFILYVLFLILFRNSSFIHFYDAKKKREFSPGLIPIQTILLVSQLEATIWYIWMAFSNVDDISLIIPAITGMMLSLFIVISVFSSPIFNKSGISFFD